MRMSITILTEGRKELQERLNYINNNKGVVVGPTEVVFLTTALRELDEDMAKINKQSSQD